MGSSPWGHKESDTIGVTEHAGTLRPPCASPQKTPSCPFPANPPHLERWLLAPPSHRCALPALRLHTNRIVQCVLSCVSASTFFHSPYCLLKSYC